MEKIVKISKSFKEAEEWDIEQQINMTPQERQRAAKELKERVYGKDVKDVRDFYKKEDGGS